MEVGTYCYHFVPKIAQKRTGFVRRATTIQRMDAHCIRIASGIGNNRWDWKYGIVLESALLTERTNTLLWKSNHHTPVQYALAYTICAERNIPFIPPPF